MTTVENPIKIFSKRNNVEFKKILETLNLTENKNNYFTDKYEIYLENTGQIIRGYVVDFFMNLEPLLLAYPPGEPEMKPDVMKETKILMKKKEEIKRTVIEKQDEKKRQNNEISNLILCKNVSEHRIVHDSLEKVAFELCKKGVIKFNCESKKYYL